MKSISFRVNPAFFSRCVGLALLTVGVSLPVMAADSTSAHVVANVRPLSTYTPKASETLDKVIQKTMGDSPLSIEILRKAFIDLNPQAFLIGKATKTRPGVTLKIPDLHQLIQAVLAPQIKAAVAVQGVSGSAPDLTDERRRWVRFP